MLPSLLVSKAVEFVSLVACYITITNV